MKRTGLILLAIGLLITLFTGLSFVTREKVVDVGSIEITANKDHELTWSPVVGMVVMVVGGVTYLLGVRKK